MRDYRYFFVMMLIMMLFGTATALVSPFLLNLWSQDETGINEARLVILFLAMVFSTAIEILLIILREKFAKHYNMSNAQKYLGKMLAMKYDAIQEKGPINLIERVQQAVNELYFFMTGAYISIWSNGLALLVILGLFFYKNMLVGAIMMVMLPVNYFGYKLLNRELARRSKKLQENSATAYQHIMSYVGQTDYLKQCDSYENLFKQMKPAYELLYTSMRDINIYARSVSSALQAVNRIAETISMAILVWNYMQAETGSVILVLVAILFPMYFNYLNSVVNANLSRQGLKVSMDFVVEMDEQRESDGMEEVERVDNIRFSIDELKIAEKTLAREIEGSFERGDVVWVRGESGAGKSSLVKLLVKFRENEGIYVNGKDIRCFTNSSLRKRVDYLSQNVPIVKGSLRDNLSFNCSWSTEREEELKREPLLAGVLQRHGLDDEIEENGANLSGGEKQKIALARVLHRDVDVMILDEFTSNIDKETALDMLNTVVKNSRNKILFIISHDDLPGKYATKEVSLTGI